MNCRATGSEWGRFEMLRKLTGSLFSIPVWVLKAGVCSTSHDWASPKGWRMARIQLPLGFLLLAGVPAAAGLQSTSTTLVVTAGGTAAAIVASGTAVTLTATVATTGSFATTVTPGQVQFCDASAKFCSDIHLLGTAQLTPAGKASFKFVPAPGSHSYNAVFIGTTNAGASTSSAVGLTVTGLYPTITTATWSGTGTGYTLGATVGGVGATAPTGTVSFLDVTNGNAVLSNVDLSVGTAGLTFANSWNSAWHFPHYPDSFAIGDFNGDGIPDIARAYDGSLLLGNGDGTFFCAATLLPRTGFAIAAGDFNGDGNLDLVVEYPDELDNSTLITALLGKGDGTFTAAASSTISGWAFFGAIAVADFNGDGIPDLAVTTNADSTSTLPRSTLFVLLGKGDGTFVLSSETPAASEIEESESPTARINSLMLTVGDFNKDDKADVALGSGTLLLGNGDGTFEVNTLPVPASGATSIAAGDFNGDGNLDLAISGALGTLLVLLGAGDGTFTPMATTPSTGPEPSSITVGDFNGDGIPDLAVANVLSPYDGPGSVTILLGDGTGNFNPSATVDTDNGGLFVSSADLNGDGISDIAIAVSNVFGSGSKAMVMALIAETRTATATAGGITLSPEMPVPHQVFASYAGDGNYKPGESAAMSVGAGQTSVLITAASSASLVSFGSAVTLTATVMGNGPIPTGSVNFLNGSQPLGTAALNNKSVATLSYGGLAVGSHSITANYSGDSNYAPATSVAIYVMVTGAAASGVILTPSATTITNQQDLTVNIDVSGISGQPTPTGTVTLYISLSVNGIQIYQIIAEGPLHNGTAGANIPAGTLQSGPNTVTASYSGDNVYAASSATTTVTVSHLAIAIPSQSAVAPGAGISVTATVYADNTYSGTMNLACTLVGSPAGAQSLPNCILFPSSVTLASGGSGATVVTVKTTAATSSALFHPSLLGIRAGGAVLAFGIVLAIPSRRRWPITTLLLFVVIAGIAGCGGGGKSSGPASGPGTPAATAGSYTFKLVGTDSVNPSVTTQTQFAITVQ
jgi:hypothetical protein